MEIRVLEIGLKMKSRVAKEITITIIKIVAELKLMFREKFFQPVLIILLNDVNIL